MWYVRLVDVGDNLESGLNAILFHLPSIDCGHIVLSLESQDVECVLAGQADQLTAVGPVNLLM